MPYELNWEAIERAVNTKHAKYPYDEVSHLFRKVAFDVYKPLNGSGKLWELRDEPDGKFLYALYDEPEDITVKSETQQVKADWEAISDSEGKNVTLSYKSVPIVRFASDRYAFTPDEAPLFAEFVKSKTANAQFVSKLMKILPDSKRQVLAGILNQNSKGA